MSEKGEGATEWEMAVIDSDDIYPWEEQVVPVFGFEDLYPAARYMLDTLNEHRPGELTALKGELCQFLGGR